MSETGDGVRRVFDRGGIRVITAQMWSLMERLNEADGLQVVMLVNGEHSTFKFLQQLSYVEENKEKGFGYYRLSPIGLEVFEEGSRSNGDGAVEMNYKNRYQRGLEIVKGVQRQLYDLLKEAVVNSDSWKDYVGYQDWEIEPDPDDLVDSDVSCSESPVGVCVFDPLNDPEYQVCLFCWEPEDR